MSDQPSISQQAMVTEPPSKEAVRSRKTFYLKTIRPTDDWIVENLTKKGAGAKVTLGRVYGIVNQTEPRVSQTNDGRTLEQIACMGSLFCENYITHEVASFAVAILPTVYASSVKALFDRDTNLRAVEIDIDLGMEATGNIRMPFEWVVIAYREGQDMAVLERLRRSRKTPLSAMRDAALGVVQGQQSLPAPGAENAPAGDVGDQGAEASSGTETVDPETGEVTSSAEPGTAETGEQAETGSDVPADEGSEAPTTEPPEEAAGVEASSSGRRRR